MILVTPPLSSCCCTHFLQLSPRIIIYRFNWTTSIPLGFFVVTSISSQKSELGKDIYSPTFHNLKLVFLSSQKFSSWNSAVSENILRSISSFLQSFHSLFGIQFWFSILLNISLIFPYWLKRRSSTPPVQFYRFPTSIGRIFLQPSSFSNGFFPLLSPGLISLPYSSPLKQRLILLLHTI